MLKGKDLLNLSLGVAGSSKRPPLRAAAVKVGNKVYEGGLHPEIYADNPNIDPNLAIEGFVTHEGKFLSRDDVSRYILSDPEVYPETATLAGEGVLGPETPRIKAGDVLTPKRSVAGNAFEDLKGLAGAIKDPLFLAGLLAKPATQPLIGALQSRRDDPNAGDLRTSMRSAGVPIDLIEQAPGWSKAFAGATETFTGLGKDLLNLATGSFSPPESSGRAKANLGKMVEGLGQAFRDNPVISSLSMLGLLPQTGAAKTAQTLAQGSPNPNVIFDVTGHPRIKKLNVEPVEFPEIPQVRPLRYIADTGETSTEYMSNRFYGFSGIPADVLEMGARASLKRLGPPANELRLNDFDRSSVNIFDIQNNPEIPALLVELRRRIPGISLSDVMTEDLPTNVSAFTRGRGGITLNEKIPPSLKLLLHENIHENDPLLGIYGSETGSSLNVLEHPFDNYLAEAKANAANILLGEGQQFRMPFNLNDRTDNMTAILRQFKEDQASGKVKLRDLGVMRQLQFYE